MASEKVHNINFELLAIYLNNPFRFCSTIRDAIVCLMEDMTVIHFLAEASGALTELDRVKLSGKIPGNNGIITWAGNVLAIITGRDSFQLF